MELKQFENKRDSQWAKRICLLISTIIFAPAALLPISGCYEKPVVQTKAPVVPVRLATAQKQDVQTWRYFTGKTGVDPIVIVPRIRGYLEEICFAPGDVVEKGDTLFKIEQFDYKNQVEQAQANLTIAEANKARAQADYDREANLLKKGEGFTTQSDIDKTKAVLADAVAKISLQKAILAEAEKQLERTIIKSPVRGKMSRNLIEKGNLVDGTTGNPPELATLMAMDPMFVYFQVTDAEFIYIQKNILSEIKKKLGPKYGETTPYDNHAIAEIVKKEKIEDIIHFDMQLLSEKTDTDNKFPYHGYIDYNDNYIDVTTGTNTVRGRFSNANFQVFPGILCRVRLAGEFLKGAILVQEKAICRDLNDKFLWVLDEQKKPRKQTVQTGELLENGLRVITSGLKEGDVYVLDGVQKVRVGVEIQETSK